MSTLFLLFGSKSLAGGRDALGFDLVRPQLCQVPEKPQIASFCLPSVTRKAQLLEAEHDWGQSSGFMHDEEERGSNGPSDSQHAPRL
jgi:hypothetical protein